MRPDWQRRWCPPVAVVLFALVANGCGASSVPLNSVEGTVTWDGQPLANALVVFEPAGPGEERSAYEGQTDEAGHYVLHATAREKGAATGDFTVHIMLPEHTANAPAMEIPEKYNARSELTATVKDGTNRFDWQLKSH